MENMMEKKFNWGTLIIGIIIGAILVWILGAYSKPAAYRPAGAAGAVVGGVTATYTGAITSINPAIKAGKIAGDASSGASVQEYQFSIPQDLAVGYTATVGDKVKFDVDPSQAQAATNIRKAAELCSIQGFSAVKNLDGSVTLAWNTTATSSGFITWLASGIQQKLDISANVLSGSTVIPANNTATSGGYTLVVTCGPNSDQPGGLVNKNATP